MSYYFPTASDQESLDLIDQLRRKHGARYLLTTRSGSQFLVVRDVSTDRRSSYHGYRLVHDNQMFVKDARTYTTKELQDLCLNRCSLVLLICVIGFILFII